jgi:hypothetical protein
MGNHCRTCGVGDSVYTHSEVPAQRNRVTNLCLADVTAEPADPSDRDHALKKEGIKNIAFGKQEAVAAVP